MVFVSQITNSGKYVLFGPNDVKTLDNLKNIVPDVMFVSEKKDFLFVMSVGKAFLKKRARLIMQAFGMLDSIMSTIKCYS